MKKRLPLFDAVEVAPGDWRVVSAVTGLVFPDRFASKAQAEAWGRQRYGGGGRK